VAAARVLSPFEDRRLDCPRQETPIRPPCAEARKEAGGTRTAIGGDEPTCRRGVRT
jgi:hypothetical protein